MTKKYKSILVLGLVTAFVAIGLFMPGLIRAGSLEPPPGDPAPTVHTLEDIYRMVQRLNYHQCVGNFYRFCDLQNGRVLDMDTGLIWLKDAFCFGTKTWSEAMQAAAALADGQCSLTDGSVAGDWRLPTKDEWEAFFINDRFSKVIITYMSDSNHEALKRTLFGAFGAGHTLSAEGWQHYWLGVRVRIIMEYDKPSSLGTLEFNAKGVFHYRPEIDGSRKVESATPGL